MPEKMIAVLQNLGIIPLTQKSTRPRSSVDRAQDS
jgi:hypothetical protein